MSHYLQVTGPLSCYAVLDGSGNAIAGTDTYSEARLWADKWNEKDPGSGPHTVAIEIAAPPPLGRKTAWQPINTAPLDGTPVIVAKIAVSHSHDGTKLVPMAKPHVWWAATARYGKARGGSEREAWFDGNNEQLVPPTHWMPIPAIPDGM